MPSHDNIEGPVAMGVERLQTTGENVAARRLARIRRLVDEFPEHISCSQCFVDLKWLLHRLDEMEKAWEIGTTSQEQLDAMMREKLEGPQ